MVPIPHIERDSIRRVLVHEPIDVSLDIPVQIAAEAEHYDDRQFGKPFWYALRYVDIENLIKRRAERLAANVPAGAPQVAGFDRKQEESSLTIA